MAKVEFYNVKKREKVTVEEKDCRKVVYTKETASGEQKRYAVRASDEGTNLTRFVNKETFDKLQCPVDEK